MKHLQMQMIAHAVPGVYPIVSVDLQRLIQSFIAARPHCSHYAQGIIPRHSCEVQNV